MSVMRGLAVLLSCALLAACVAHGQARKIDPRVHVNYSPYSEAFYRELMTGRVNVFTGLGRFSNVVQGLVYASDGTVIECAGRLRLDGKLHWISRTNTRWALVKKRSGMWTEWNYGGGVRKYASKFYDPETGAFNTEIWSKGRWIVSNAAQIQDTWPRALADACPQLKLPDHIRINEKQTSLKMDELRRQDPDAPVRHFPGSHLTAPGRTGLGASRGAPTTTRKEVLAFVKAQNGNILLSPSETGYVFVGGQATSQDTIWTDEVWRLDDEGKLTAYGVLRTEIDARGQEWALIEIPGQPALRHPIGYPFPVLPTGHRHAAFRLTDRLVESGEPVALPWMPSEWKDFTFLADGTVRARRADGGPDRIAHWRWTRGQLHVAIDGNRKAVFWTEVAEHLGMEMPELWAPADGQRIGPQASASAGTSEAAPATSGTGKCVGDHEGTATWTLGADGQRVWDTSGCKQAQ